MSAAIAWGLLPAAFLIGYLAGYRQSRKRDAAITAGFMKVMNDYAGTPPKEPR
jgi:hypothetical protein